MTWLKALLVYTWNQKQGACTAGPLHLPASSPLLFITARSQRPPAGGRTFSDVLRRHYRAKRPELQRQMADWRAAVAQGAAAAGGQSHGMHGMAQYLGMQGQGGGNQVEFMEKAVRQVLELLEKI